LVKAHPRFCRRALYPKNVTSKYHSFILNL